MVKKFKSSLVLFAVFMLSCVMVNSALAAGNYELFDVPDNLLYEGSRAQGINNNGEVVGHYFDSVGDTYAFIWKNFSDDLKIYPFETLPGDTNSDAWAINDSHVVAGTSMWKDGSPDDGWFKNAATWDVGTSATLPPYNPIHAAPSAPEASVARGINSSGVVIGTFNMPGILNPRAGFYNNSSPTINLIESPVGPNAVVDPYDINDAGHVVGTTTSTTPGYFDAFVYNIGNAASFTTLQRTNSQSEWSATAINNLGLVGGYSLAAAGSKAYTPYLWLPTGFDPSTGLNTYGAPIALDLPNIKNSTTKYIGAEIYSINSKGQIVGTLWESSTKQVAFLYDTTVATPEFQVLNDLLLPQFAGWDLKYAREINDLGQIVGYGINPADVGQGFVLNSTVVPEPISLILFPIGLGAFGFLRKKNILRK